MWWAKQDLFTNEAGNFYGCGFSSLFFFFFPFSFVRCLLVFISYLLVFI